MLELGPLASPQKLVGVMQQPTIIEATQASPEEKENLSRGWLQTTYATVFTEVEALSHPVSSATKVALLTSFR